MGLIAEFWEVNAQEAAAVIADPVLAWEQKTADFLPLDQGWHGLHYLLTGVVDEAPWPLGFLVSGGSLVPSDEGVVRVFSADEVADIASSLAALSVAALHRLYDPLLMDESGVYPEVWTSEGDAGFAWLAELFEATAAFMNKVKDRGHWAVATLA